MGDCNPAQFLERVESSRARAERLSLEDRANVFSVHAQASARVAALRCSRHFLMTRSREKRQLLIEVAGSVDLRRWC